MQVGSSTSNMYQPKLLHMCAKRRAQNGTEVNIDFQGTGNFWKDTLILIGRLSMNKFQFVYIQRVLRRCLPSSFQGVVVRPDGCEDALVANRRRGRSKGHTKWTPILPGRKRRIPSQELQLRDQKMARQSRCPVTFLFKIKSKINKYQTAIHAIITDKTHRHTPETIIYCALEAEPTLTTGLEQLAVKSPTI